MGEFKFEVDQSSDDGVELRPTVSYENFSYAGEWKIGT